MIWYFLMGWIGGFIGAILIAKWSVQRKEKVTAVHEIQKDEALEEILEALRTRDFKSGQEMLDCFSEIHKRVEEKKHGEQKAADGKDL